MAPNPIRALTCLTSVAIAFLAGCSAYVGNYHYSPRPAVALVPATQPQQPPALASVATVIGVHRADSELKIPTSVEVRFRLDNGGPQTVTFDPASLQLISGGLTEMASPILQPAQPATLIPGQSFIVAAYFPFPPGKSYDNTDLDSLQLRWVVMFDGRPLPQAANFQRMAPAYYGYPYYYDYGPYYGPWLGVGFYGGGYGWHHR